MILRSIDRSDTVVYMDDGSSLPRLFSVTWVGEPDDLLGALTVEIGVLDLGRTQLSSITLRAKAGQPLSAEAYRAVKLLTVHRDAVEAVIMRSAVTPKPEPDVSRDELLREVASHYRAALANGSTQPAIDTATALGKEPGSGVRKLIMRARRAGYLTDNG